MEREEKQRMWRDVAESMHTPEGMLKGRALTASMTKPILRKVEEYSVARKICNVVKREKPGEILKFQPVRDKSVWLLPGLGYMAQDYSFESLPGKFSISEFSIQTAGEWSLKADIEVIESKMDRAAKTIARYEHEALMRTIVPPATHKPVINCIGKEFPDLTEYMLQSMRFAFEKNDKELGYILTPETLLLYDDYDVAVLFMDELGRDGTCNINGEGSDLGCFTATDGKFNDYELTCPNTNNYMDTSAPSVKGEYQVYGLSKDITEHLIMAITHEYECFDDPTLLRRQLFGFYGWQKMGLALRDSDCVVMAAVNSF